MTQEQVDKISDEFGSTFALHGRYLFNLLAPKDIEKVRDIIMRNVPTVKSVDFQRNGFVSDGYFMYTIEVIK